MDYPYHSALAKAKPIRSKASNFCRVNSGIAFVHDMANGWPNTMDKADVIYSDLPWMHGYIPFYERAGKRIKIAYPDFITRVGVMISKLKVPIIMVTGRHAIKYLKPSEYLPIKLNGDQANACLWNITPARLNYPKTELEILNQLARLYKCIGDPFCGYGRSGRIFAQAGRVFIMSDINPKCIGYISEKGNEWITT